MTRRHVQDYLKYHSFTVENCKHEITIIRRMDRSWNTEWINLTILRGNVNCRRIHTVPDIYTSPSLRLGNMGPPSWVPLSRSPCTFDHLPWHGLPPPPVPGTGAACPVGREVSAWTETCVDLRLHTPLHSTRCCSDVRGALDCAFLCQARFQQGLSADRSSWLLPFLFHGAEQDGAASVVLTHEYGQLKLFM